MFKSFILQEVESYGRFDNRESLHSIVSWWSEDPIVRAFTVRSGVNHRSISSPYFSEADAKLPFDCECIECVESDR